jgi:hypothetical protein
VTDIEAALRRQGFRERITEKLASDPDWTEDASGRRGGEAVLGLG